MTSFGLLSSHDDPRTAADYLLGDIERDLAAVGLLPSEALGHFRDRMADIADTLKSHAINAPRRPE